MKALRLDEEQRTGQKPGLSLKYRHPTSQVFTYDAQAFHIRPLHLVQFDKPYFAGPHTRTSTEIAIF